MGEGAGAIDSWPWPCTAGIKMAKTIANNAMTPWDILELISILLLNLKNKLKNELYLQYSLSAAMPPEKSAAERETEKGKRRERETDRERTIFLSLKYPVLYIYYSRGRQNNFYRSIVVAENVAYHFSVLCLNFFFLHRL